MGVHVAVNTKNWRFVDCRGLCYALILCHFPTHFLTGWGVQISHRAAHNVHKCLEVIILLLDQVVLDCIALDKIVLENGVCPDTELGATLGLDTVADGDDYVEVVELNNACLSFPFDRAMWSGASPLLRNRGMLGA